MNDKSLGRALLPLLLFILLILIGMSPDATAGPAIVPGWEEIGVSSATAGGISNNDGVSITPSLALSLDGAPIVAWADYIEDDYADIYLRRWDGSAWVEMGGSASGGGVSNNEGDSWEPSLAVGPDGAPVVAWSDNSTGDYEIYVRRWDGTAWVEIGSGSASGGGISDNGGNSWEPSLAFGPDGTPVVAWSDYSGGNFDIYVRRWDGSAWVEIGGSASGHGLSQTSGDSADPSLAIGPDGAPVVAWSDNTTDRYEIYVRRWNGSAWIEMGAGSASGIGLSLNGGDSNAPSLAIGPDGAAVAVWSGAGGNSHHIYGLRWDGSAWMEMAGSASGDGISNPANWSGYPSLALSADGSPVVTWMSNLSGPYQIYAKRWNAAAWLEIGQGSAADGGISGLGGWEGGAYPSIAIGPDDRPIIAWQGDSFEEAEIYIRRGPLVPWGASFAPFTAHE